MGHNNDRKRDKLFKKAQFILTIKSETEFFVLQVRNIVLYRLFISAYREGEGKRDGNGWRVYD